MERTAALCGHNTEVISAEAYGIYSYHCAIKAYRVLYGLCVS
jgi:hypothetical protein